MKKSPKEWGGAWAAIPTPFRADLSVDVDALKRHVSFLCDHRIDGIAACATTGEAATMSASEKMRVLAAVLETVNGRVPVIAGVGTNDTRTTVDNALEARSNGADGLLVVTPYYNKPNQEGQYRHFMTVADSVDLPQILYNVPGRTGTRCFPKTLGRLAKHPNIVGVKDATADMVIASQTRIEAGPDFLMFSGDDGTTLPFVAVGGVGAISVVADIAPALMHDIISLARSGNYDSARALHEKMLPLFSALFSDTSPIPLKCMLSRSKLDYPGALRSPLFEMDKDAADKLCAPLHGFIEAVR
ncbi:MAG: 4-hydroxy-tetrahydrodipicolinate synthase [Proteobacteria bacterium]|nr:4-hydroxy-tetrahydrodipicolinate synthase [Pseudomonadota bacterium]